MSTADLLHFHCPACGRTTSAPISNVGQTARCVACGGWIVVPGTSRGAALADPGPPAPTQGAPIVLLPVAPAPPLPSASSITPAQVSPAVPAAPTPTPPIQIDISKIPGLSTRKAVYKETRSAKTYGLAHKPGTTFGHAFGGSFGMSFGCLLGVIAAAVTALVLLFVFAYMAQTAATSSDRPAQRSR